MQPSQDAAVDRNAKVIYWHRDLPPLEAEPIGEHTIEATSGRVPGTIAHRDELWGHCKEDLMAQTRQRLTEEIARLGGRYVHVHEESIDTRHDDATGEAWLHGRFGYTLYRWRLGVSSTVPSAPTTCRPTRCRSASPMARKMRLAAAVADVEPAT